MSEFKIGDVVRLKSGGPDLVVLDASGGSVSVVWRNGDRVEAMLDRPAVMFRMAPKELG